MIQAKELKVAATLKENGNYENKNTTCCCQ